MRRPGAFALALLIGVVGLAAGIGIAAATGSLGDLPWAAIIGVVVVMAMAYAARRRLMRMPDEH